MPAFDPVRDAVLNSPITPSQPLPTTTQSSYHRTATPTRRATDLSVLLNSQPLEPPIASPPPPTRTSTLSHLLIHSDTDQNSFSSLEPQQRRQSLGTGSPQLLQDSPHISRRLGGPSHTGSPVPLPATVPAHLERRSPVPGPSASTSSPFVAFRPSPQPSLRSPSRLPPTKKQSMHTPTVSTIPYNPSRITPAGLVLKPMSSDEIERYKNYRGIGTQILSKRKRDDVDEEKEEKERDKDELHVAKKRLDGDVGVVVGHYNSRPDVGVVKRLDSPIIGLKKFNNWVKSVLVTRFAHPALAASPSHPTFAPKRGKGEKVGHGKVLDMGCGKGGDLPKWAKARVRELIGVDIAAVSIEQARARWERMRAPRFDATFAALDCYTEPLSKAFAPAKLVQPFDVVSMQFCMHYAFETLQKARCMLGNVSRWLRPGGVFIGTIPNAEQLLEHLNEIPPDATELSFGNDVYRVRFESREKGPVFGHKYWFFLKDAVDNVPEYIVKWDSFVQMAAEFQLFPVYKEEFHHVFTENQRHPEFGPLMMHMKVVDADGESSMDEEQWEAANIYIAFAFEKR